MTEDLPDILARRAELIAGSIALEEVISGRRLSYAELDSRAGCAAALLRRRGVGEGDRVAILCRNRIGFFELLFACARIGAILVPLNWRMTESELDALVRHCGPRLIVHGAEDEAAALRLPAPARLALDGDYEALILAAAPVAARALWPADAIWYLLYTSGTTGEPKAVVYTFRMALANYVNIGSAIDLRASDTSLNFLPLFHTAGINLHSLPTLFHGGRVLVLPAFDAEAIVRLLEARRLDNFFGVPTVYQDLLDHPRFRHAPLGQVRHWACGGAPLPDALAQRCRAAGLRVCNGMGMTETGPTAFLASPASAWEKIGSIGKPQLLCSVRLVDEALRDVPEGEVGEVLFSGPGVTPGYWRDEDHTRAAFTADGWLRSGDLARRDGDGDYFVVGRRKEMFISGGENVYPAEVENVLAGHPAVAEAAVVGAPDPRWGEVGQAFVRFQSGVEPPSAAELQSFCRARLAGYKVPGRIAVVVDFPRTPAGKIQKHKLRPPAAELHCSPARHKAEPVRGY